jgi:hypothetical protein
MATLIARNDFIVVRQVTTLTPTVANTALYDLLVNGKTTDGYTSDGTATAQEIVEGVKAALATNTKAIPEITEITFTENDTTVIATGRDDGQPFTVTEGGGSGNWTSITATTAAKSKNHWIAENFDTGALPASLDTVILSGLSSDQSFYWGLDHNTVTLGLLDIRADSEAEIGLPEWNEDGTKYYQATYRDCHLKISATLLKIGEGIGKGSKRIKINLGTNACSATIFKTSTEKADQDEAPVHLSGSHASNALHVISGEVDLAMLPGTTAQWPIIIASGGKVRCGTGCTLGGTIEASGSSLVETRTAVTTVRTRDNGRVVHIGSGAITTADLQGGPLEVQATAALTISTLNGYSGKRLDLSKCDAAVTVTDMNIYATPDAPFEIFDPNNKLVMTNAAACQYGAQSLRVITGSGKTVRVV